MLHVLDESRGEGFDVKRDMFHRAFHVEFKHSYFWKKFCKTCDRIIIKTFLWNLWDDLIPFKWKLWKLFVLSSRLLLGNVMIEIKSTNSHLFVAPRTKKGDKFYVQAQGHTYIIGSFSGYISFWKCLFVPPGTNSSEIICTGALPRSILGWNSAPVCLLFSQVCLLFTFRMFVDRFFWALLVMLDLAFPNRGTARYK